MQSEFLFPAPLKQLLRHPDEPHAEWAKKHKDDKFEIHVKTITHKKRGKSATYNVITTDKKGIVREVERVKADFTLLEKHLNDRFPGACVPPCPKGNPALFTLFLKAIAKVSYYRYDAAFKAFTDVNVPKYKKSKLKSGDKEGSLRWRQAMNEYPDQSSVLQNFTFLHEVQKELEDLYKSYTICSKVAQDYMSKMEAMAKSSVDLQKSFARILEGENQYSKMQGTTQTQYGGMRDILDEVVKNSAQHAKVVTYEYGSVMFHKIIANEILYDVLTLNKWRKNVALTIRKKQLLDNAKEKLFNAQQTATDSAKDVDKLSRLEQAEREAYRDFLVYTQGMMGVELFEFKKARTERMKTLYENITNFHLKGTAKIGGIWGASGVAETDLMFNDDGFFDDLMETNKSRSSRTFSARFFGGRNSTSSLNNLVIPTPNPTAKAPPPGMAPTSSRVSRHSQSSDEETDIDTTSQVTRKKNPIKPEPLRIERPPPPPGTVVKTKSPSATRPPGLPLHVNESMKNTVATANTGSMANTVTPANRPANPMLAALNGGNLKEGLKKAPTPAQKPKVTTKKEAEGMMAEMLAAHAKMKQRALDSFE